MSVSAAEFPYETGDKVVVSFSCGQYTDDEEIGTILSINDGPIVHEVEIEFEPGEVGVYAPEQVIGKKCGCCDETAKFNTPFCALCMEALGEDAYK